jgi:hypothetical protein
VGKAPNLTAGPNRKRMCACDAISGYWGCHHPCRWLWLLKPIPPIFVILFCGSTRNKFMRTRESPHTLTTSTCTPTRPQPRSPSPGKKILFIVAVFHNMRLSSHDRITCRSIGLHATPARTKPILGLRHVNSLCGWSCDIANGVRI